MKAYRERRSKVPLILNLSKWRRNILHLMPRPLYSWLGTGSHWVGGWVGLRAGLKVLGMRKIIGTGWELKFKLLNMQHSLYLTELSQHHLHAKQDILETQTHIWCDETSDSKFLPESSFSMIEAAASGCDGGSGDWNKTLLVVFAFKQNSYCLKQWWLVSSEARKYLGQYNYINAILVLKKFYFQFQTAILQYNWRCSAVFCGRFWKCVYSTLK